MRQVAEYENSDPEIIRQQVAAGIVVIPKISTMNLSPGGGQGLKTKVNIISGTSPSHLIG
ncbi:MAG: phosphomethylpyrimidine synthase ThiC [Desulfobacterales bacterium]